MDHHQINFLAVLVATIAKGALGALWYSPVLFIPAWMRATGVTKEQMNDGIGKAIAIDMVGNFVMAFILALALHAVDAKDVMMGLGVAFHAWLGFVLVVQLTTVLHEKRPLALLAINAGYQLIGMLIMGAILAAWT